MRVYDPRLGLQSAEIVYPLDRIPRNWVDKRNIAFWNRSVHDQKEHRLEKSRSKGKEQHLKGVVARGIVYIIEARPK
jgi:hypothetical protein